MIESAQPATASRRLPFALGRLADERLAQLVSAGRERAFAVLYERYHQPLYRYCRSMLRNDQDAQDVLQSTFASALAALQQRRRNAPFRPWLFRIAHNEAITVIRRRRDSGREISDSLLGAAAAASEEADTRARMSLLIADLAQLPERQRAALLMRELNGLSHAEISVALATSVTAAKQAIFDARTALTEFAEGRVMACEEVRRKISERDGRVLRSRRVRSHMRDCSSCAAFAAAISERRGDLQALVPVSPAAASAALLARLGSSVSRYGGSSGAGASSGAGTAGKLGTAALASKTAVGATVVVTAAVGFGALPTVVPISHREGAPSAHATPHTSVRAHGAGSAVATAQPAASRSLPPATSLPRDWGRHGSTRAGHGSRGAASTHATAASAATASQPAASSAATSHGQSALPHGKSAPLHGKSALPHGKSAQAPGHVRKAAADASATQSSKPLHVAPGQTGTRGKSAGSPGHNKTSSAATDQAAAKTPPGQAAKAGSKPAK
ncbi:MAG: RNA polymerase sigma factor [Solirubrobacteraceae bacterium]